MLLANKVVVVTGAAGPKGLGFATASQMAAEGARVVIIDLEAAEPAKAAALLGPQHLGLVASVADKVAVDRAFAHVLEVCGSIDVLANNAGLTQPRKTLDISQSDYDIVLDVNLRGTLLCSQAAIPAMQRQGGGSIICISSGAAQRGGGFVEGPHYCAAKAGVLGLVKAMARELAPSQVRVNAITPGLIGTDQQLRWITSTSTPGPTTDRQRSRGIDCADGQGKSILGL